MVQRVTPMLRVHDMMATLDWYTAVGFVVASTHEDDGVIDWAMVTFGEGRVMFNAGGRLSAEDRREVDLYVHTEHVDELFGRIKARVEVREPPHDTFYGMREFIVRDPSGFWVTFGEPLTPESSSAPSSFRS
jgi:uncharacterized glyoxalase superfamily protein PhnB